MIIETTPNDLSWYLVDIDGEDEEILLSCCCNISNEDMLLQSITIFKRLAGVLENYHVIKREKNKTLVCLLNNRGDIIAQGMHETNLVEKIINKIVKNYEKTS